MIWTIPAPAACHRALPPPTQAPEYTIPRLYTPHRPCPSVARKQYFPQGASTGVRTYSPVWSPLTKDREHSARFAQRRLENDPVRQCIMLKYTRKSCSDCFIMLSTQWRISITTLPWLLVLSKTSNDLKFSQKWVFAQLTSPSTGVSGNYIVW